MDPFTVLLSISWFSGVSLLIAFLISMWPSRGGLRLAGLFWFVGSVTHVGQDGYALFAGVAFAMAFTSRSFPVLGWMLPLASIVIVLVEALLLRPTVHQASALRAGRILLLGVGPLLHLLPQIGAFSRGIPEFPLGARWFTPVLLWFLIRERIGQFQDSTSPIEDPPATQERTPQQDSSAMQ